MTSREHRAFGAHGETANFQSQCRVVREKLKLLRNKLRAASYIGTKGRDLRVLFTRLDKDHSSILKR